MNTGNKDRQKVVIVLGPPRSGTSMTAGILSILGVDMGNLRDADSENPKGYFEDKDFLALCDDILRAADPEAHGFNPPSGDTILRVRKQFDNRIRELLAKRALEAGTRNWGWKVTSTCFTLPLFLPYLENPYFVIVLRNPLDIAKSVVRYTKHKSQYKELGLLPALTITNKYYYEIYKHLSEYPNIPRCFLSYEDITTASGREANRLAKFLDISVTTDILKRVEQFVSPGKTMRTIKLRYKSRDILRLVYRGIKKPYKIPGYISKIMRRL